MAKLRGNLLLGFLIVVSIQICYTKGFPGYPDGTVIGRQKGPILDNKDAEISNRAGELEFKKGLPGYLDGTVEETTTGAINRASGKTTKSKSEGIPRTLERIYSDPYSDIAYNKPEKNQNEFTSEVPVTDEETEQEKRPLVTPAVRSEEGEVKEEEKPFFTPAVRSEEGEVKEEENPFFTPAVHSEEGEVKEEENPFFTPAVHSEEGEVEEEENPLVTPADSNEGEVKQQKKRLSTRLTLKLQRVVNKVFSAVNKVVDKVLPLVSNLLRHIKNVWVHSLLVFVESLATSWMVRKIPFFYIPVIFVYSVLRIVSGVLKYILEMHEKHPKALGEVQKIVNRGFDLVLSVLP